MFAFLVQNVGQNLNINVGNKSSVNVADFKLSDVALITKIACTKKLRRTE